MRGISNLSQRVVSYDYADVIVYLKVERDVREIPYFCIGYTMNLVLSRTGKRFLECSFKIYFGIFRIARNLLLLKHSTEINKYI